MSPRLDPYKTAPGLMKAMVGLEETLRASSLDARLGELVRIRASQINGCAFCLHMHSRDARRIGESEERLHLVAAWRESSYFDARERAALAWTESLTRLPETGAPDADFEPLGEVFSREEIAALTVLVATINAWNRIAVAFRHAHPRHWDAGAPPA